VGGVTKLQLHVVCAVVAATRAIEAAGKSKADEVRTCGEWSASLMHVDGETSVRAFGPKDERVFWTRSEYRELDAPLIALTGDMSEPRLYGVAIVASYDVSDESVFAAIQAGGIHVRELPRTVVGERLAFDWRGWEPNEFSGMTRAEILVLPKENRLQAYKANPGETVSHYDCQCPKCKYRYAVDCLVRDADTGTKCPHCEPKEAPVA